MSPSQNAGTRKRVVQQAGLLRGSISGPRCETARFVFVVVFIGICLLGGGSARADAQSLLYVRPAALLLIMALALTPGRWDFRTFRPLFVFIALLAAVMAIQIVPLPVEFWSKLPGRSQYTEAAIAADVFSGWRALSITPDLTINSLMALIPALAMLIGLAALRPDQRGALLLILIVGIVSSAIFGIAQISAGRASALYTYRITHDGSPVGFFANRNHQAALLAMLFPLLRLWSLAPTTSANVERIRFWVALATAFITIPTILITGSRAGFALGLLGLTFAALVRWPERGGRSRPGLRYYGPIAAVLVGIVAFAAAAVLLGRAEAVDRLVRLPGALELEQRLAYIPTITKIAMDFFPFGSGFGSFDDVFRSYEADWMLNPSYFNHAHNDFLEILMTGGVPAIIVLLAFLVWAARRTIVAFRPYRSRSFSALLSRCGAMMIVLALGASIVDYPTRTAIFAIYLTIASGWLAQLRPLQSQESDGRA